MKIHECNNVKVNGQYTGGFTCRACSFVGPLEKAIEHTTSNQFIVESKKRNVNNTRHPLLGRS